MVGELLCPDCGGVVGATETTEAGPPCKCFATEASSSAGDDTNSLGDEPVVAEPPKQKICRMCGKDVAGHRRVKDSAGYLCIDCAKAEEKRELGDRIKCKLCGHLVKDTTLKQYEGTTMCSKCYQERMDLQKQQIKRIGVQSARMRTELSQLGKLLLAGGVLLAIIVLSSWHLFGHHH